ncbi:MAG: hypothetical protein AB7P20_27015, partial [Rhizobiaceae bacterium]
ALGPTGDLGHPASGFICPHQKCESHLERPQNPKTSISKQSLRGFERFLKRLNIRWIHPSIYPPKPFVIRHFDNSKAFLGQVT